MPLPDRVMCVVHVNRPFYESYRRRQQTGTTPTGRYNTSRLLVPPTSAAASNAARLCLVTFPFHSRRYPYDVKKVLSRLVRGETVVGLFFLFLLMFTLLYCPLQTPPQMKTTSMRLYYHLFFILSLLSPLAFAFCPTVFCIRFFFLV